jgi:microcystin-dependent protein
MFYGQGLGLSLYDQGQSGGSDTVTLLQSEIPFHKMYQTNSSANVTNMNFASLTPSGGSLPHNNLMPYLVLNFCIALQGVFPPRP